VSHLRGTEQQPLVCSCDLEESGKGSKGGGAAPQAALLNALALPTHTLLKYKHAMDVQPCEAFVKVCSLSLVL
jgi:hypothetical protein